MQISHLQKLGCTNIAHAYTCIHVYIELTEVKKYWDVKICYDKSLDSAYITARKNKNTEIIIFIPIPVANSLSFNDMKRYFNLCQNNESIYLAIVDPDSTSVYYQISDGIIPPAKPLSSRLLARNQREYNDNVLRRNTKIIEEAALCGTAVDLTVKNASTSEMQEDDDESDL